MAAKTWTLAGWLILSFLFLAAQTEKIADLEQRLKSAEGNERLAILNALSEQYAYQSTEKALAYAQRALDLAESLPSPEGKGRALRNFADAYNEMGQFERALQYFARAEAVFCQTGDKKAEAKCINNSGVVYARTGDIARGRECFRRALIIMTELKDDFEIASCEVNLGITARRLGRPEEALGHYQRALPIFDKIKHMVGVATTLGDIGLTYKDLGRYDRAIEFYFRALAIEEKNGTKSGRARVLGNIGNVYKNLNDDARALEYYQRSLTLQKEIGAQTHVAGQSLNIGGIYLKEKQYPRAAECFDQALRIWRRIKNRQGQAEALGNLAVVYQVMGRTGAALDCCRQALALDEALGNPGGGLETLKIMADIHADRGEYGLSLKALRRGLAMAQARQEPLLVRDFYDSLASVSATRGDFRLALEYYRAYERAKDVIFNRDSSNKIAELAARYETAQKQQQIALLEKDNELLKKNAEIQRLQISRSRLRIGALASGIVLLIAVFLFFFRRYLHLLAFWKRRTYISHYKLERQIGSGAMGVVWQATDLTGGRSVALKLIREEHASDVLQRKRFLNESYLVDRLDHPNIVKVFERGEYNQSLFIAMELLSGRSLADTIADGRRLPLPACRNIMRQLASALAGIHTQGILHRDVKPANVMLTGGPEGQETVKLLDFGLAKSPSLTQLTATGEILGTIHYMAPELITQRQTSVASDVYALGVVFYELLTQEKPFLGENPGQIVRAIIEGEPLGPERFRPDLPAGDAELVMRMLAKDPQSRPSDHDLVAAFAAG